MIRHEYGSRAAFGRCFGGASLALACLLGTVPTGAQGEGATFRFGPPDGTRYVETSNTTQVLDFGQGRATTTRSELNVRYSFRKLPDGYSVTSRVLGGDVEGPGAEGRQLVLEALTGVAVTYRIDQDGRLVEATGMAEAVRRMREVLPPDVAAMVAEAFSDEAMIETTRADWQSEVLNLKGRSAELGSVWLATERYLLPSGDMVEFHVALKVTGDQTVGGKECVRVEFNYASDPAELRSFLGTEHASLLSSKKPLRGPARVSGRGHRIVDPATLLPYGQKIERVIETTMAVPSRGHVPVTIRQDKTYWYSYEPAD